MHDEPGAAARERGDRGPSTVVSAFSAVERYRHTLPAGAVGAFGVPVQERSTSTGPTAFAKLTVASLRSAGARPGNCTTSLMSLVGGVPVRVVTLLEMPKAPVTVIPDGIVRVANVW